MALYDYQVKAVEDVRSSFRRGKKWPCLVLPTGAGKTRVALEMCRLVIERGGRVVWFTHRDELARQTIKSATNLGIAVGGVGAELEDLQDVSAGLQVCMIQTCCARDYWPPASFIVLDEAHLWVTDTFGTVTDRYDRGVGLTATPARGDGTALGEQFDDLVDGPSIADLIHRGTLCPFEITGSKVLRPGEIAQRPVDAYLEHANGTKAVVFAPHVAAAEEFLAGFVEKGIPAAIVVADTPKRDRKAIFEALAWGSIRVLVGVGVFGVGWDDPTVETAILARGYGHASLYLQHVGRVLRAHPGKKCAKILDLRGTCYIHGPPDEARTYHLDGDGIRRRNKPEFAFCPVCGRVGYDGTCPCGKLAEELAAPTVVGAKLEKYTAKRREPEILRVQTLARWIRDGESRGYKFGWALAKFKAVYGSFPEQHQIVAARERNRSHESNQSRHL